MTELYRILVTRPDGKTSLAVNNTRNSKYCGSKYFSKHLADNYVRAANQLAAERESTQTFTVLADGDGYNDYT